MDLLVDRENRLKVIDEVVSTFAWDIEKKEHVELIQKIDKVLQRITLGDLTRVSLDEQNHLIFLKKGSGVYKFYYGNTSLEVERSHFLHCISLKKESLFKCGFSDQKISRHVKHEYDVIYLVHGILSGQGKFEKEHPGFMALPKLVTRWTMNEKGESFPFYSSLNRIYPLTLYDTVYKKRSLLESFFFVHQIFCAVYDFHNMGFVHGDLKEENFFADPMTLKLGETTYLTHQLFLGDLAGARPMDQWIQQLMDYVQLYEGDTRGSVAPGGFYNCYTTSKVILMAFKDAIYQKDVKKAKACMMHHDRFGVGMMAFSVLTQHCFLDEDKGEIDSSEENEEEVCYSSEEENPYFEDCKEYVKKRKKIVFETFGDTPLGIEVHNWLEVLLETDVSEEAIKMEEALEGLLNMISKNFPLLKQYLEKNKRWRGVVHGL